MRDVTLNPFIEPTGVVVVGVSGNTSKLGYGIASNLVNCGFGGEIHFVSQKRGKLFGRQVYSSLVEVPDPVDLAVLIVPAPSVCDALEDCKLRGIHAAIVISSGFREVGDEGAKLERDMMRIAENSGIRLLGPNCIGLIDTHFPLDTTFLPPPMPTPGDVAFISQSGAICAAIIDWARGQGFGFSKLISLGNQADINETDMLSAVADDINTRVLTLYLESVSNGRKFVETATRITRQKPIIALKVGRFASGQRAAASHTGALAGDDIAYQAAFQKSGIFRASSSEEMFDWASALACSPLPGGRQMAVLTNAGGPGVIAADALEIEGLSIADLLPETRRKLAELLPPAAGLHNPIDMLASASPQLYADCLKALIEDANVDGIMVILPPPPMYPAEETADILVPIIQSSSKPVVIALMGEHLIKTAADHFRKARIPEYRFPERAASALSVLVKRAEFLNKMNNGSYEMTELIFNIEDAQDILRKTKPGNWLDYRSVNLLMKAYEIPYSELVMACNSKEAGILSSKVGFPLVLKVASQNISHKSDVGGVMVNIQTPLDAEKGFNLIMEKVRAEKPEAAIEGVFLQKMYSGGNEVIIGSVHDPQFGQLMMFGSGGIEVEGLKDIAFSLAPLNRIDVSNLINRTWAGRRLQGYRNIPRADINAIEDILMRFSHLVVNHPEISEIEMNPLKVFASGAIALDVRVKL